MHILIAEDSESLRRNLGVGLENLGYTVTLAANGKIALDMMKQACFDLLILDIMMPFMSGLEVLAALPNLAYRPCVIVLSAKTEVSDRIGGLTLGADDYMSKPFSFDELVARIVAVSRRKANEEPSNVVMLTVGDYILDTANKQLLFAEHVIPLTVKEYKIIHALFENKGRILSPVQISEAMVGYFDAVAKNTIEAHLSSVRKKLKAVGGVLPVIAKRGFGYVAQK